MTKHSKIELRIGDDIKKEVFKNSILEVEAAIYKNMIERTVMERTSSKERLNDLEERAKKLEECRYHFLELEKEMLEETKKGGNNGS